MIDDRKSVSIIRNAGLVIAWPFLTRFFETLGFVKNGKFVNEESRHRSVFLLQQLVCNTVDFPEYALTLNKLLVGLPIEAHLSPKPDVTEEEKDLCSSLLNGLIANWNKVQSSTPEAIQETFLQRDGVLIDKTDHIALVVQRTGVDMLLETLPWNISLISLPWIIKSIHVEWI